MRNQNRVDKTFIWDFKDKTVRGSFINFLLTVVLLSIIALGCFYDGVCSRLVKLSELVMGFYFISLGVWKTGQVMKYKKDADIADAKAERKEICGEGDGR